MSEAAPDLPGFGVHAVPDEALGNTSYLVAVGNGSAFSVDPRRDADEHLALAADLGLQIGAVFETHLHADFVSGVREVHRATGAAVYAPAGAGLAFPHVGVDAGDRVSVGDSELEVVATPGHTPEHVAYLATMRGARVIFSGGSLIVGGAARTDLTGADRTEELARAQYASLRLLASFPGETVLCPTHGGGSFCSATRARNGASTIAQELERNPLLGVADEAEFIERLLTGFGSYPTYFRHLREVNRAGPELLSELPPPVHLSPADAAHSAKQGAWLVDARPAADWAAAHPEGAVSIELRPAFASWLGWVVPFGARVVLVVEPGRTDEAWRLARRIGYDRIDGWISFQAWREAGMPVGSVESIDPHQAAERAAWGSVLLDVRQRAEHEISRLPGAVHLELGDIIAGKTTDSPAVVTYCGHGERSATAASLLARRGVRVANLAGGVAAWREAGLPMER
jgi:glyoxylase-like metal-dependent hydrolase (beta-lactamase superfamily II)/rhodanese-related sulfurtransferase